VARVLSAVRHKCVQSARGQRPPVPTDGFLGDSGAHGTTGGHVFDAAARPRLLLHSTNQRAHSDSGAVRRETSRPTEDG
jgi:hypothetical protein